MKNVPRCPGCQSDEVIPIVYGMPSEELLARQSEGRVIIGGSCVSFGNPRWFCKKCGKKW